ncbi:hypothetical protein FO488_15950 [Geobacter sp. FeAm09]|uniref:hypothetical protein n=1 Tax=Geobacter sp. FeAm09 TaxID=2597769 RepID=UPI0011EFC031|nr:hypothetical protein [Geobacter sp. FeAm09]QEM69501.1 hypothetical protein FO488_15950 [Geobacter sp. FeAm09]
MSARIQLKIPEKDAAAWKELARQSGSNLSAFIKNIVNSHLSDYASKAVADSKKSSDDEIRSLRATLVLLTKQIDELTRNQTTVVDATAKTLKQVHERVTDLLKLGITDMQLDAEYKAKAIELYADLGKYFKE